MNEHAFERRILWFDEDDPPLPPPPPASMIDGLIPTGIGIFGVLASRPGPGDDLRVPIGRAVITFAPVTPAIPPPPVAGSWSGVVPVLDPLVPVGAGIWGTLQARPQPGDALR